MSASRQGGPASSRVHAVARADWNEARSLPIPSGVVLMWRGNPASSQKEGVSSEETDSAWALAC
jgi:hypothetical protein